MKVTLRTLLPILSILATSCVDHDFESPKESFVFGRYYGYCAGDCIHVFVLKENSLSQSEGEKYPDVNKPWSLTTLRTLTDDQKEVAEDLPNMLPQSLLNSDKHVIGCPDCADFGGLYIELNQNGTKRFWYIDNATQDQELKDFISIVNDRITTLIEK